MIFDENNGMNEIDAVELLEELSINQPQHVNQARQDETIAVAMDLNIEPGNASEKGRFKIAGTSQEANNSHISAILDMPLFPGDVYKLSFPAADQSLPQAFALCTKCHLLPGGLFEVAFDFFKPVNIQGTATSRNTHFEFHPED